VSVTAEARRLFDAQFRWVVLASLSRFKEKLDLSTIDDLDAAYETFRDKALELAEGDGLDPMKLDVVQAQSLLAALVAQVPDGS
jgi:hypothetical protein